MEQQATEIEIPSELATYIESKTNHNGTGGRPSFLKRIVREGGALSEILSIVEKHYLKGQSTRSIADSYKRRGYQVNGSTIYRIIKDVEPFKETLIAYLKEAPRKKRFYNPKTDSSDYATVKSYISRAQRYKLKRHKQFLQNASRCWKALNKRDPLTWKAKEIQAYLETLPPAMSSNMLDSIRVIAPQIQNAYSPEYIPTKAYRRKVRVRKKEIFGKEVELILKALRKAKLAYEELIFCLHVTLGAREGESHPESGMRGLNWGRFKRGFTKVDLWESKGELWSRNCPTNTLFPHIPAQLRELWKQRGKPKTDKVILGGYKELTKIYQRIRACLAEYYDGKLEPFIFNEITTIRPHDSDKIHCNLLWEAGVPMEIVAGSAGKGEHEGEGLVGRIWRSLDIMRKHYLSLTQRSDRYLEIMREVNEYNQRFNGGS